MVKYLCIIQARINSSRLPSKVMLDLAGKTLLERVYESASKSKKNDKIIVAISNEQTDDIIELKLNNLSIEYYRGDLNNVLQRFYEAALKYNAKNVIRVTADNPLMDGIIIDDLITLYESKNAEYCAFDNAVYGLSAEVFSFDSLVKAYNNSRNNFDREHVTPYIKDNCKVYIEDIEDKYKLPNLSATIDTVDDYIKINKFYLFCEKNNYIANIDNFILNQLKMNSIDTLEDWERAEYIYKVVNKKSDIKYLGYEVKIDYGDYERDEITIDNLEELETICNKIETDDEYFNITYREKYIYNEKTLYSKKEYIQIENKQIPIKYKLVKNIHNRVEDIYQSESINKNDIINTIKDLENLLKEII